MTICIAIKVPCKEIKHRKLPVRYPPGIVISADTRYVRTKNQATDNGIKIWTLSKFAIAGFAGDVQLAEISMIAARFAIEELSLIRHQDISNAVQNWLLYYYEQILKSRKKHMLGISLTEILLSIYDSSSKRFYLYLLSSKDGFIPKRRDGIIAIGSGSTKVIRYLEKKIEIRNSYISKTDTGLKTVQTKDGISILPRSKDDMIEHNLMDISLIVTISLDELIKTSGLSSIGGLTQNYILNEMGANPVHGKYSDDSGKTWKTGTATDLKGYADMMRKKYLVPTMKKDLSILRIKGIIMN